VKSRKSKLPGRPTVRTAANSARVLKAISTGCPLTHAARASGISYSALCDWKKDDPEFAERLEIAISEAVELRLKVIQDAANAGDWRAAQAWLAVVLPMEYGRQKIDVCGPDGGPLTAGVQIYLPAKQVASVETGRAEPAALVERNGDANGH
jgi:hypothetical protein